jgi:cell wall-associated NlpC family hydrolase
MKWLLTITMASMLVGCTASSANASQLANDVKTKPLVSYSVKTNKPKSYNLLDTLGKKKLTWLESQIVWEKKIITNRKKLNSVVNRLIHRVGKTPYVFSGSSIYGWDCSGMVVWAYEQLGVELPHSATKQAYVGKRVKTPKVGDVVIFGYKGYKSFYHSAIYIGKGKVVNANRGFGGTHIQPLTDYKNNRIVYVRVVDTP